VQLHVSKTGQIMAEAGAELESGWARALAGLIAVAAWVGIGLQFHAHADGPASWPAAPWRLLGYFTTMTNLLVGAVFTGVATRTGFGTPGLLAGTLLSILFRCGLRPLLQGLHKLTAGAQLANSLMHRV
jgi:hypothetical protein